MTGAFGGSQFILSGIQHSNELIDVMKALGT
jgi:hypothetical protein